MKGKVLDRFSQLLSIPLADGTKSTVPEKIHNYLHSYHSFYDKFLRTNKIQ